MRLDHLLRTVIAVVLLCFLATPAALLGLLFGWPAAVAWICGVLLCSTASRLAEWLERRRGR